MNLAKLIVSTIVVSSIVMAHCGSCGTGSSKSHDEAHKNQKMEKSFSELNLSEKQEEKVRKINQNYKKAKKKIKAKREKALSKVLTADQMKQYKESKSSCSNKETKSDSVKKTDCDSCES